LTEKPVVIRKVAMANRVTGDNQIGHIAMPVLEDPPLHQLANRRTTWCRKYRLKFLKQDHKGYGSFHRAASVPEKIPACFSNRDFARKAAFFRA
jgi:hypothetical protein